MRNAIKSIFNTLTGGNSSEGIKQNIGGNGLTSTGIQQPKEFSKTTIRAMAIAMLAKKGRITNRDLVSITNGQTWLTSDLRRDGYIKPMHYDTWEVGNSGKRYKVYQWSGKKLEAR